jgi:hypothetical protein
MKKLPTSLRVLAVIQLCIVFTLLAWSCLIPFMGDLFMNKTKVFMYKVVMGDTSLAVTSEGENTVLAGKLKRNEVRFHDLPITQQNEIVSNYNSIKQVPEIPWTTKIFRSLYIILFELPPFERAWILLSLVVSLMILFGKSETKYVVWLLPLIALCYSIDNRLNGLNTSFFDEAIYPSEKEIVQNYVKEPLKPSVDGQREQLLRGWHLYLIDKYVHETPSQDKEAYTQQVERGEYGFSLARLEALEKSKPIEEKDFYLGKESNINLLFYMLWNLFFATFVYFKMANRPSTDKPQSQQNTL